MIGVDLGTEEAKEYLELLEFWEIVAKTILPSMGNQIECLAVSYTHLTLPTICSV